MILTAGKNGIPYNSHTSDHLLVALMLLLQKAFQLFLTTRCSVIRITISRRCI